MKPASRTAIWMVSAFVGALAITIGVMLIEGTGRGGTIAGLRLTARFSYAFFWLGYVGGASVILFGPTFNVIVRHVREFGLAFASAQFVHVGLVIWLAWISPPQSIMDAVMPFFAIGVVWTYFLAALSIDCARNVFSPYMLKVMRTIGSEYIALTFFADFVLVPQYPPPHPILYIPFWAMLLVGPSLRLAAAAKEVYGRHAAHSQCPFGHSAPLRFVKMRRERAPIKDQRQP
jgi:hypothetical protein